MNVQLYMLLLLPQSVYDMTSTFCLYIISLGYLVFSYGWLSQSFPVYGISTHQLVIQARKLEVSFIMHIFLHHIDYKILRFNCQVCFETIYFDDAIL